MKATITLNSVAGISCTPIKVNAYTNKIEDYAGGLRNIARMVTRLEQATGVYVDDLLNAGFWSADNRKEAADYMVGLIGELSSKPRNDGTKASGKPWTLSAARSEEACPWYMEAKGVYAVLTAWSRKLAKLVEGDNEPNGNEPNGNEPNGNEPNGNEPDAAGTPAPPTAADAYQMIQNALRILGGIEGQPYTAEVAKIGAVLPVLQKKISDAESK